MARLPRSLACLSAVLIAALPAMARDPSVRIDASVLESLGPPPPLPRAPAGAPRAGGLPLAPDTTPPPREAAPRRAPPRPPPPARAAAPPPARAAAPAPVPAAVSPVITQPTEAPAAASSRAPVAAATPAASPTPPRPSSPPAAPAPRAAAPVPAPPAPPLPAAAPAPAARPPAPAPTPPAAAAPPAPAATPLPAASPPSPAAAPAQTAALPPRPAARAGAPDPVRLLFAGEGQDLTPAMRADLRAFSAALPDDESLRITINAYAGGDPANPSGARRQSLGRALAVRSALIEDGVRSMRIDVRALGLAAGDGPPDRVDVLLGSPR